ncbi:MAG: SHOCT domain-containing protein [Thermoplasmata archaeon]|uniref:SHOCT domain-containing protein n=1 Tax=Candidatus Sysuiplasma superficiale TaxID=2823368 RepID=A0A8J7YYV9_9ARCH|nr:SHOCT domain-containing protein [Candidatus Sysuiplasma superficiale]MBX8644901.1 SHOCT domain-containing protein [Candidatus Sysuiplasma superficiale]
MGGTNFQSDPELSKFTVIPEKIMKKVQQVLQPGESIEFSLRGIGGSHTEGGNVAGGFRKPARGDEGEQMGHPWFIVTNKRLLLASTGILSFESRSLAWDQLNSVELQQGIIDDHVIINGMSAVENWTFWKKLRPVTLQAVQLAQKKIDDSRNRVQQPSQAQASDPITELKMRFVRGEITEEQYNRMLNLLKGQ